MKLLGLLGVLVLASNCYAAGSVTCKLKVDKNPDNAIFLGFDGGSFTADLASGNVAISVQSQDGRAETKSLVSQDVVSSFGAKHSSCKPVKIEATKRANGTLKAIHVSIEDCEVKNPTVPTYTGYVGVLYGADFDSGKGVYQELFYDGNTKSPGFFLENCSVL